MDCDDTDTVWEYSCSNNSTSADLGWNNDTITSLNFYQDTLYTALAGLAGNIAGVLLIYIVGGKILLCK